MKTVEGKYASALVYSDSVEDYALAQIKLLCDDMSFKGSRIRVMPDVHPGKVGPVGFTATVTERILPSVVGIDIGCGMSAAKIKEKRVDCAQLDKLVHRRIPAGSAIRSDMHRFAADFDFARLECAEHIRLLFSAAYGGNNRMRILAILTPTDKWGTKIAYTNFRRFFIKDGYLRIAPEVFKRITTNRKTAQKHFDRLKEYAPATGEVRILRLTEKQYANITYLTGCPDEQEKNVGTNCHIMLQ